MKKSLWTFFVELQKMGRIFEAVRPHMVDFCDHVDPVQLMRRLSRYLSSCDLVSVHSFETVNYFYFVMHCPYCIAIHYFASKKKSEHVFHNFALLYYLILVSQSYTVGWAP